MWSQIDVTYEENLLEKSCFHICHTEHQKWNKINRHHLIFPFVSQAHLYPGGVRLHAVRQCIWGQSWVESALWIFAICAIVVNLFIMFIILMKGKICWLRAKNRKKCVPSVTDENTASVTQLLAVGWLYQTRVILRLLCWLIDLFQLSLTLSVVCTSSTWRV